MRWFVVPVLALALLGCGDSERNPLLGGGGGGPSDTAGGPDASTLDASGEPLLVEGLLCEVIDLRQPSPCLTNPGGLTISVLDAVVVSNGTGGFSFTLPTRPSFLDITITDPGNLFRPSVIRITSPATGPLDELALPVLTEASVIGIEANLGEGPSVNTSTIIGFVNRDGAPLAGASVVDAPAGTLGGTYYDSGAFPFVDIGASTGIDGVFAIFGAPADEPLVSFTLRGAALESPRPVSAPALAGALTFVSYSLPAP